MKKLTLIFFIAICGIANAQTIAGGYYHSLAVCPLTFSNPVDDFSVSVAKIILHFVINIITLASHFIIMFFKATPLQKIFK